LAKVPWLKRDGRRLVCGGVIIAGIAVSGGCAFCEAVTAFCLANRASHGIAPVLKPGDALE